MFLIWIDKDGYYTDNYIENETQEVEVNDMPQDINHTKLLFGYKFNAENHNLEKDEEKIKSIEESLLANTESLEDKIKILGEQIEALQQQLNK